MTMLDLENVAQVESESFDYRLMKVLKRQVYQRRG